MMRAVCWYSCALCAVLAIGSPVFAQTKQQVPFNHFTDTSDRAYVRKLADGEQFTIQIDETCPDVFAYEVHGIVRSEPDVSGATAKAGGPLKKREPKTIPVVHDAKYGGYIVSITRKADANPCEGGEKLQNRTLLISTPLMDWDLSFSGGFTVSSLTSPSYYLRPHPTETGKKQVQEDTAAKDAANLGIATFVHVYHHRRPWLAGTFGLGIREGNKTEYFLGGGIRFSDKATLNLGLALGPVSRLPTGVNTTNAVTDDNVLTNLPTRVAKGFFVGVSYSFINVRDKLQQPFASSGAVTAGSGGGSAGASGGQGQASTACTSAKLDQQMLAFGVAGEAKTVKVVDTTPADCTWKVETMPAWIQVDTPSGTKGKVDVKVTAEKNGTMKPRDGIVKIAGVDVKVTQTAN